MHSFKQLSIVLIALVLAGCASQKVDWDYDPGRSLAGLKTYAWLETSEDVKKKGYQLDALMDQRVQDAVDRGLQAKGLRRVKGSASNTAQVDFLVNYMTTVKTRRDEQQITTSFGYGYSPWGVGMNTETRIKDYEEGTLIVDMIDPQTKKLIWRGQYRSRLKEKMTPQERTDRINQSINAILSGFPRPLDK